MKIAKNFIAGNLVFVAVCCRADIAVFYAV
jgi:hypothetical protein